MDGHARKGMNDGDSNIAQHMEQEHVLSENTASTGESRRDDESGKRRFQWTAPPIAKCVDSLK